MSGRTKRRVAWLAGVFTVAAVAAVAIVGASSADPGPPGPGDAGPAPKSKPLHGRMEHIIQHFGCTDSPNAGVCSTFDAHGDFEGDGYVIVDSFPSGEFGYSEAHTVIHTKKGDLRCHEAALFVYPPDSEGDSPFMDICVIDGTTTTAHQGSTGKYAGATGFIQETGTFHYTSLNPPIGEGSLEYTGKITYAH